MYALNAANGTMRWSVSAPTNVNVNRRPFLVGNDTVIFMDNSLYTDIWALFVVNGTIKWKVSYCRNGFGFDGADMEYDHFHKTLIMGCDDSKLYRVNVTNGALVSTITLGGKVRGQPRATNITGFPVIYVAAQDANLYCVNISSSSGNMSVIWKAGLGEWVSYYTMQNQPAISHVDRTVLIGSDFSAGKQGRLWSFEALSGKLSWSQDASAQFGSPLVMNGVTYVGTGSLSVFAYNATTGEYLWRFGTTNGMDQGALYMSNDLLYAASVYGYVFAINTSLPTSSSDMVLAMLTTPARVIPVALDLPVILRDRCVMSLRVLETGHAIQTTAAHVSMDGWAQLVRSEPRVVLPQLVQGTALAHHHMRASASRGGRETSATSTQVVIRCLPVAVTDLVLLKINVYVMLDGQVRRAILRCHHRRSALLGRTGTCITMRALRALLGRRRTRAAARRALRVLPDGTHKVALRRARCALREHLQTQAE
eukprot:ANDGO_01350.mRNA.1 hypothetical protein